MGRVRVAVLAGLPTGTAKRVRVQGSVLTLVNVGGTVFAVDDRCPHEGGSLSRGLVEAGTVRCPVHGACFDLATGRALEPPAGEAMGPPVDRGVRCYPVTVVDDGIHLDL